MDYSEALRNAIADELVYHRLRNEKNNLSCICGHPYRMGESIMTHRADMVMKVLVAKTDSLFNREALETLADKLGIPVHQSNPLIDTALTSKRELNKCPFCGAIGTHYMTHICPGCTCDWTLASIPGEPQMGSYLEGSPNPECPVHFPLADSSNEKTHD